MLTIAGGIILAILFLIFLPAIFTLGANLLFFSISIGIVFVVLNSPELTAIVALIAIISLLLFYFSVLYKNTGELGNAENIHLFLKALMKPAFSDKEIVTKQRRLEAIRLSGRKITGQAEAAAMMAAIRLRDLKIDHFRADFEQAFAVFLDEKLITLDTTIGSAHVSKAAAGSISILSTSSESLATLRLSVKQSLHFKPKVLIHYICKWQSIRGRVNFLIEIK